jgi:hypothetical protein
VIRPADYQDPLVTHGGAADVVIRVGGVEKEPLGVTAVGQVKTEHVRAIRRELGLQWVESERRMGGNHDAPRGDALTIRRRHTDRRAGVHLSDPRFVVDPNTLAHEAPREAVHEP